MKRGAILLLSCISTFYVAGSAAAEVVPIGGGAVEAPPPYDVKADATAESVLADARAYFDEQSYAWALAAADALAAAWPAAPERAESDYWRLRCLMQVERFAEVYRGFEDYYRRHGDSPWAAETLDYELDVYTDCEDVLEDYTNRTIAHGWDNYLKVNYGLDFGYQGEGVDKLYAKRLAIIKQGDGLYGRLMDKAADAATRLRWADRRAFNHIKVSAFLDFSVRSDEEGAYAERKAYNRQVAALEMSDDMRSMVAFLDGLQDLFMLPPPAGGPAARSTRGLNSRRLAAARAAWQKVAADYGAAPGALMARAALAHYQLIYDNEPEKAAAAFAEVATLAADAEVAAAVEGVARGLAAPALAITEVKANPAAAPEVTAALACRGLPEVEASVYELDPAQYPAFYDAFLDADAAAATLPGVTGAVATKVIETGCEPGGYGLNEATATWDGLAPGLYLLEAHAGGELSRAVFSLTGAAVIGADDGHDLYLEAVDAATGEPVPIAKLDAWLVSYRDRGFQEIEDLRPVTLATGAEGAGVKADLRPLPEASSVYLVVATARGPVIYAAGTAYDDYDAASQTLKGEVITDRPLYRPGDTVRYKVIWREVDFAAKTMKAAASRAVDLGLYLDHRHGERLLSATATTDEFGTCAGEFAIPATARLGGLTIGATVKDGDREYRAEGGVNLAEPAKPEYELRLEPSTECCVAGENVSVEVAAKYYSGEPMAGAPLTYRVDYYAADSGGGVTGVLIKDTRVRLDENGRYVISFRTPGAKKFEGSVSVHVKVGDETAHILEADELIVTRMTDRCVGIEPDKSNHQPGEIAHFTVSLSDLHGRPVAGRVAVEAYAGLEVSGQRIERGRCWPPGPSTCRRRAKAATLWR